MSKKSIIQPRTLKGFRDFLPEKMVQKEKMINTIKNVYKSYGFLPIDTPVLEYSEILLGKGGDETDKQMFRFEDNGGRDVAMRFDLTIPFARYTAQHFNELNFPFKRYHVATVWRGENTQAGRYREFMQCDFDTIGTTSPISDAETISVIYDSMKALGVKNFTIRVNNRMLMNGLLKRIKSEDKQIEILRIIDKLSKIGDEKVSNMLTEQLSLSEDQINDILTFIKIDGTNAQIIERLKEDFSDDAELGEGINRLEQILNMINKSGIPENNIKLDLSITRGLDYYTGIVMETTLNDLPKYGSVCSGGRYDNLAELYTKQILPGIGASIGLDRLLSALEELNVIENNQALVDVLIINMDKSLSEYYMKTARELRQDGISTEIYPQATKLGKQFTFADNKGFKLTMLVGENELKNNLINLRVVESGERLDNIKKEDLISTIKKYI